MTQQKKLNGGALMKKVRFIAWMLVFALTLGLFPALATNQTAIDVSQMIREIEQRKQNPETLFPEDGEWSTETKETLAIVEEWGEETFSQLPKEAQDKVLSYLNASPEEMQYFEDADLDTERAMSCVFVMRESGLTAQQVLIAQKAYEQVEDVIPALKQLEAFSFQVEMTEEQRLDLQNRILEGSTLSEAVEASGYDFTPASTGGTVPEPFEMDLSYVAPFALQSGNEQISLNSGNLSYTVPLVSIPGVNGLDLNLAIQYNSSDAAQYVPRGYTDYYYGYFFAQEYEEFRELHRQGYTNPFLIYYYDPPQYKIVEFGPYETLAQAVSARNVELNKKGTVRKYRDEWWITVYRTAKDSYSRTRTIHQRLVNGSWEAYATTWNPTTAAPDEMYYSSGVFYGWLPRVGTDYSGVSYSSTWVSGGVTYRDAKETWTARYEKELSRDIIESRYDAYNYPGESLFYEVNGQIGLFLYALYDYDSYATTSTSNEWQKSGELGAGWSWNLPRYNSSDRILHLGNGSAQKLNSNLTFKNYTLKDMSFEVSNAFTSSENVTSSHVLRLADGTAWWFDSSGRCIGQTDRFGNSISYGYSGNKLVKAVDTAGRVTTITYSGTTITLTQPDGQSYVLQQGKSPRNATTLASVTDPAGQATSFTYTSDAASFTLHDYGSSTNYYTNLKTVIHPTGGQTQYTYSKAREGLGNNHSAEVFKVSSRKEVDNGVEYAAKNFAYTGTYTGYPSYYSADSLPTSYTYSSSSTNGDGVYIQYTFNNKGLLIKKESSKSGVKLSSRETEYNADKLPTKVTQKYYNSQSSYTEAITLAEYDNKGNVTASWDAQANGSSSNTEHKTIYTYDASYGLPLSKTYKADASTTLEERYTLTTDKKLVQVSEIYENNTLRKKTEYGYDAFGQVTEAKEYKDDFVTFGRSVYTYDTSGNLTSLYCENVRNAAGQLVQTPGLPAGCVGTQYEYDIMGRVFAETNDRGFTTEYTYDELGNVETVTHPDGSTVEYVRDYVANTLQVTDETGAVTRYTYNAFGHETEIFDVTGNKSILTKTYDSEFRLLTEQPYGLAGTLYSYDEQGRVTGKVTADAGGILAEESYLYDDGHSLGLKVTKIATGGDAPDQITVSYADNMGRVVREGRVVNGVEEAATYTYDYLGRKTTEKSRQANAEGWIVSYTTRWTYTYDGQISREYNVNGDYIEFAYENTENGRVVRTRDYKGNWSEATYDELNRLIREKSPVVTENGTTYYTQTEYYYDKNGQADNLALVQKQTNAPGEAETWSYTENTYDARGLLTQVEMGGAAGVHDRYTYTYDAAGRQLTMTDALNRTTSYAYDYLGRQVSLADPLNQTETYTYNDAGLLTSKTDRNGTVHTYEYDGLGRVTLYTAGMEETATTYTMLGQKSTEANTTSLLIYEYDGAGRVVAVAEITADNESVKEYTYDAGDNRVSFTLTTANQIKTTEYEYDLLSRLTEVSSGGMTSTYSYDANGNRTRLETGTAVTTYEYNLANLVTKLRNELDGELQSEFMYVYRLDGNQIEKVSTVLSVSDTPGTDPVTESPATTIPESPSPETTVEDTTAEDTSAVSTEETFVETTISVTDEPTESSSDSSALSEESAGDQIEPPATNGLDMFGISQYLDLTEEMGILEDPQTDIPVTTVEDSTPETSETPESTETPVTTVVETTEPIVTTVVETSIETTEAPVVPGNPVDPVYSVERVTYIYDDQGRLSEESYELDGLSVGAIFYTYDLAGNRATMIDTRSGAAVTTEYDYDSANRLTSVETADALVEYTFDPNGNQLTKTVTENGSAQTETYTYNAQNQLVQVQNSDNTAVYTYNPDGLRHSKTVNGETRVHVWDGANMAAEILDNGDVVWYIRGVNLLWSDAGVIYDTPDITLYFHNAHGDVVGLAGSFSRNYSYDAFGNELDESGQPVSTAASFGNWTSSDINPFRYCGEYFDDELNALYLRARYYDATIGRFTQQDSWEYMNQYDPLSLNLYTYCHHNPVLYIDYTGNTPVLADLEYYLYRAILHNANTNIVFRRSSIFDFSLARMIASDLHYSQNLSLKFSGFINDQLSGNAGKIEMGFALFGSNACGWVAAYNAFQAIGKFVHPAAIVREFENHNALILDGAFGVNPLAFEDLFRYYGVETSTTLFTTSGLDAKAQAGRAAILLYFHANGAHYVTVIWNAQEGKYTMYNGPVNEIISVESFLNEGDRFFTSLITIY